MQKLNGLWQVVNAASTVRDIAQQTKVYQFLTGATPITFYLQAETARIEITRWHQPQVEVSVRLQAAFGWKIATDQDDAGVYIAAKRRIVVGGLSSAAFEVHVPQTAYLVLKLASCSVNLNAIDGMLHIPPVAAEQHLALR
ncbi:MAG TPA: hypothetical protein VHL11_23700 [Phototrophicaceae bacterium]|jgi:hypothetical protein|nr:hypothetical protein [Phototrophicaceae bacterium]